MKLKVIKFNIDENKNSYDENKDLNEIKSMSTKECIMITPSKKHKNKNNDYIYNNCCLSCNLKGENEKLNLLSEKNLIRIDKKQEKIFNFTKNFHSSKETYYNNSKKLIEKNDKNNYTTRITNNKIKNEYENNFNSENFEIIKLLGEGSFGKTYLVEDPMTKIKYGLKKILINDETEINLYKSEFELLIKILKEYPELKIIKIYGLEIKKLDKYNLVLYVLMEAAKSDWETELKQKRTKKEKYTETELIKILYNLVDTLANLQKIGISHRDIKPQNILCFENNIFKISDFGEAKNKYNNKNNNPNIDTIQQTLRGTELYMSPILYNALKNHQSNLEYNAYKNDVFSLGICLMIASCLEYEECKPLIEIREAKDTKEINTILNKYLYKNFSINYINILSLMLEINEANRPDFIELNSIIKSRLNVLKLVFNK